MRHPFTEPYVDPASTRLTIECHSVKCQNLVEDEKLKKKCQIWSYESKGRMPLVRLD